jgi:predicted Na+-dependent transporter
MPSLRKILHTEIDDEKCVFIVLAVTVVILCGYVWWIRGDKMVKEIIVGVFGILFMTMGLTGIVLSLFNEKKYPANVVTGAIIIFEVFIYAGYMLVGG